MFRPKGEGVLPVRGPRASLKGGGVREKTPSSRKVAAATKGATWRSIGLRVP